MQPTISPLSPFDAMRHIDEQGEYWTARELAELREYKPASWHNFVSVLKKAQTACINAGSRIADHFYDAVKMVQVGSGAKRTIKDKLTHLSNASQMAVTHWPQSKGQMP